jgi:hypothetical protein
MVVVWKNPTPVLDGSFRASCAGILERQRYNTVVLASETACGAQEARVRGEVLGSRPNTLNSRPRQALFLGRLPPGAATIYTQTAFERCLWTCQFSRLAYEPSRAPSASLGER